MNKTPVCHLISSFLIILFFAMSTGCNSTNSDDSPETVVIGMNFELTGDLAEVGKESRQSVEMYLENLDSSEGIEIGGSIYQIDTRLRDNESTADRAVEITSELISEESVLAMIGPNASYEAVPAGETANNAETLMISPWATNVQATLNRPWVFRVPFIDSFQGNVLAQFANSQYSATNACILYASDNAYSEGLAESFTNEWTILNGTIAASEIFQTGDEDLTTQLNNINNAHCDFLFLPQYANEVPAIVKQAHDIGITVPILGSDSWASQTLLDECGADCEGYFITKQFVASGATGMAEEFVNNYQARYSEVPGDVAALTWDAMLLMEQALKSCGTITGNLTTDRTCIRNGMASIQNLEGVTGPITFNENGDPQKCVSVIRIMDNEFTNFDTVCPE